MLQITNRKSLVIWNRGAQIARISPESLSRAAQIALSNRTIGDWASVQIAVRIAMPIPYTTSQNNELFWEGSHCLKSLVICDSRFESQIAIAVKSRDLEHLGRHANPDMLAFLAHTPTHASGSRIPLYTNTLAFFKTHRHAATNA